MSRSHDPDAVTHLLANVASYYALSDTDRKDEAPTYLRSALRFVAAICGPEMISNAYGELELAEDDAQDGNRGAALEALSERLWLCFHLFQGVEQPGSGHAIADAANEAYLIANGDKPSLFAPIGGKQGRRGKAYALALNKVRALEWDEYLGAVGTTLQERRDRIVAAYGISLDAFAKWKSEVSRHLGSDAVAYRLQVAGRLARAGQPLGLLGETPESDGAAYRKQLGYG